MAGRNKKLMIMLDGKLYDYMEYYSIKKSIRNRVKPYEFTSKPRVKNNDGIHGAVTIHLEIDGYVWTGNRSIGNMIFEIRRQRKIPEPVALPMIA